MSPHVNIPALERAIAVWQEMINCYKDNMNSIKANHRLTWWFRPSFWRNERYYVKSFGALIQRRIQLQTAIKNQKEN